MNNTTKIIAATLITLTSYVSIAGLSEPTDRIAVYTSHGEEIGDNPDVLGTEEASEYFPLGEKTKNIPRRNSIVVQFNVQSTNKSKFNAVYLASTETTLSTDEICDPDRRWDYRDNPDIDHVQLITYLPYSPHFSSHGTIENNDDVWGLDNDPSAWRSVHTFIRVNVPLLGKELMLVACSRDKDGGVDGDLDDFFIGKIVVQYMYEEVSPAN